MVCCSLNDKRSSAADFNPSNPDPASQSQRPRWDSNPRITDLQSVPLVHLGTRPRGEEDTQNQRGMQCFQIFRPMAPCGSSNVMTAAVRSIPLSEIQFSCIWPYFLC